MEFKEYRDLLSAHFQEMCKSSDNRFFALDIDPDMLWALYLESFPEGANEIYRERREMDCSACRHFIKRVGNIVAMDNGYPVTLWDFEVDDEVWSQVNFTMSEVLSGLRIKDVFLSAEPKAGVFQNLEYDEKHNVVNEWNHFYIELPEFLHMRRGDMINTIRADWRDRRDVLERTISEIPITVIEDVLDMIEEGALYRGDQWKDQLKTMVQIMKDYQKITEPYIPYKQHLFFWNVVVRIGVTTAKIRNTSIGTLLVELAEGKPWHDALNNYNFITDPFNYQRSSSKPSTYMIKKAKEEVAGLGLLDDLERRFAHLTDVNIKDVLWADPDATRSMKTGQNVFDVLSDNIPQDMNRYEHLEGIHINDFLNNMLPKTQHVEVLFEPDHRKNLVSLITEVNDTGNLLFKWSNNFSWTYTGNITDRSMREDVKKFGGQVDGLIRFSIRWNTEGDNLCDMDAHLKEPNAHIYYSSMYSKFTKAELDVDVINPQGTAIENIIMPKQKGVLSDGNYVFFVECFNKVSNNSVFEAEIEFDGQIYNFEQETPMGQKQRVEVGRLLVRNGKYEFKPTMSPLNVGGQSVWGLTTGTFIPVSTIMLSPNYWNEEVGNKHYFFFLAGCENPEPSNGFFNEFLRPELKKHRKTLELVASSMQVEQDPNQLSGLGFSSTLRSSVITRCDGKIYKIVF